MKIKAKYVMEDEFEKGVRIHLNFGHTFGHAVEKLGGYKRYSHGEAVGIGMLIAAQLSWRFGYPLYYKEIKNTLEAWSLPTVNDYSGSDMMKSSICASLAAARTSSRLASEPMRMFSRTLSRVRNVF